eukprot:3318871-Heterocapsa_arctica.AAC.1
MAILTSTSPRTIGLILPSPLSSGLPTKPIRSRATGAGTAHAVHLRHHCSSSAGPSGAKRMDLMCPGLMPDPPGCAPALILWTLSTILACESCTAGASSARGAA